MVHTTEGPDTVVKKYPKDYDHTLPTIHLHYQEQENGPDHVRYIMFPKAYRDEYNWDCIKCDRKDMGKAWRHKCIGNIKTCQLCHRWLADVNTCLYPNNEIDWCDSEINRFEAPVMCQWGCKRQIFSESKQTGFELNCCAATPN